MTLRGRQRDLTRQPANGLTTVTDQLFLSHCFSVRRASEMFADLRKLADTAHRLGDARRAYPRERQLASDSFGGSMAGMANSGDHNSSRRKERCNSAWRRWRLIHSSWVRGPKRMLGLVGHSAAMRWKLV